jgi:hypothetical protein
MIESGLKKKSPSERKVSDGHDGNCLGYGLIDISGEFSMPHDIKVLIVDDSAVVRKVFSEQ